MAINILAFGIAKEIIGASSVEMPAGEAILAEDLKTRLEQKFPRLKELKSFMIAVNGSYAAPGTLINPEDEVAIIPPVSGG